MWDLIVSVPDDCLSFYFAVLQDVKTVDKLPWHLIKHLSNVSLTAINVRQ